MSSPYNGARVTIFLLLLDRQRERWPTYYDDWYNVLYNRSVFFFSSLKILFFGFAIIYNIFHPVAVYEGHLPSGVILFSYWILLHLIRIRLQQEKMRGWVLYTMYKKRLIIIYPYKPLPPCLPPIVVCLVYYVELVLLYKHTMPYFFLYIFI